MQQYPSFFWSAPANVIGFHKTGIRAYQGFWNWDMTFICANIKVEYFKNPILKSTSLTVYSNKNTQWEQNNLFPLQKSKQGNGKKGIQPLQGGECCFHSLFVPPAFVCVCVSVWGGGGTCCWWHNSRSEDLPSHGQFSTTKLPAPRDHMHCRSGCKRLHGAVWSHRNGATGSHDLLRSTMLPNNGVPTCVCMWGHLTCSSN